MDISDIEISDEYQRVFEYLKDKQTPAIFVTGQAGTGKSVLIDLIRYKIEGVPVIAPTGVAALNVGGQTIHSFFRIAPGMLNPEEVMPNEKAHDMFKKLQYLIIDEISMVRADLMDIIDTALRKNRLNDIPFGGVKMILVGDMFQLPPIITQKAETDYLGSHYHNEFFFASYAIQKTKLAVVELTKVYRQKDADFVGLLSNVREGINLPPTVDRLNSLYTKDSDGEHITLTPDNRTADGINEARLNECDPAGEQIFDAIIEGTFDTKRPPAPEKLRLRIGARVMCLKNDQKKRYVNGSIGTVTGLDMGSVTVLLDDYPVPMNIGREMWEHKKYGFEAKEKRIVSNVTGSFNQIPLTPAWACTIHKSQGKTFSKVNIDISSNIFANGQLYVALSRCRSIEGIHINRPIKVADIRIDPMVTNFYKYVVRS